jgi:uncharacterized protein with PIN domain
MIAVDISTLMAIVLNESEADACIGVLEVVGDLLISAATVAEHASSRRGKMSATRWHAEPWRLLHLRCGEGACLPPALRR